MAKDNLPGIPPVPAKLEGPQLRRLLEALTQAVRIRTGQTGNPLDESPTRRELIAGGASLVGGRVGGLAAAPVSTAGTSSASQSASRVPPTPVDFTAQGLFDGVILTWAGYETSFNITAQIWRHTANDQTAAGSPIGSTTALIYVDRDPALNQDTTYYYWIRTTWQIDNVTYTSPVVPLATSGVQAQLVISADDLLQSLSGQLTQNQFAGGLSATIDLIGDGTGLVGTLTEDLAGLKTEVDTLAGSIGGVAYSMTTAPQDGVAGTLADGDRWYDTDDQNHPYIYNAALDGSITANDGTASAAPPYSYSAGASAGRWVDARDNKVVDVETQVTAIRGVSTDATFLANLKDPAKGDLATATKLDQVSTSVYMADVDLIPYLDGAGNLALPANEPLRFPLRVVRQSGTDRYHKILQGAVISQYAGANLSLRLRYGTTNGRQDKSVDIDLNVRTGAVSGDYFSAPYSSSYYGRHLYRGDKSAGTALRLYTGRYSRATTDWTYFEVWADFTTPFLEISGVAELTQYSCATVGAFGSPPDAERVLRLWTTGTSGSAVEPAAPTGVSDWTLVSPELNESTDIWDFVQGLDTFAGSFNSQVASSNAFSTLNTAVLDEVNGLAATANLAQGVETILKTDYTTDGTSFPAESLISKAAAFDSFIATAGTTYATAAAVEQVQAQLDLTDTGSALYGAVQQVSDVVLDSTSGVQVTYSLKLDANGHVNGLTFYNTVDEAGEAVDGVVFAVSKFTIASPGVTSIGFEVEGSRVVMDGAFIKNATIDTAQIGLLAVDTANIADGAIAAAKIGDAEITNAKIGDTIQSTDYNNTTKQGWRLQKSTNTFEGNGIAIYDSVGRQVFGSAAGVTYPDTAETIRNESVPVAGVAIPDWNFSATRQRMIKDGVQFFDFFNAQTFWKTVDVNGVPFSVEEYSNFDAGAASIESAGGEHSTPALVIYNYGGFNAFNGPEIAEIPGIAFVANASYAVHGGETVFIKGRIKINAVAGSGAPYKGAITPCALLYGQPPLEAGNEAMILQPLGPPATFSDLLSANGAAQWFTWEPETPTALAPTAQFAQIGFLVTDIAPRGYGSQTSLTVDWIQATSTFQIEATKGATWDVDVADKPGDDIIYNERVPIGDNVIADWNIQKSYEAGGQLATYWGHEVASQDTDVTVSVTAEVHLGAPHIKVLASFGPSDAPGTYGSATVRVFDKAFTTTPTTKLFLQAGLYQDPLLPAGHVDSTYRLGIAEYDLDKNFQQHTYVAPAATIEDTASTVSGHVQVAMTTTQFIRPFIEFTVTAEASYPQSVWLNWFQAGFRDPDADKTDWGNLIAAPDAPAETALLNSAQEWSEVNNVPTNVFNENMTWFALSGRPAEGDILNAHTRWVQIYTNEGWASTPPAGAVKIGSSNVDNYMSSLAVDTLYIADQAITQPVYIRRELNQTPGGVWQTVVPREATEVVLSLPAGFTAAVALTWGLELDWGGSTGWGVRLYYRFNNGPMQLIYQRVGMNDQTDYPTSTLPSPTLGSGSHMWQLDVTGPPKVVAGWIRIEPYKR